MLALFMTVIVIRTKPLQMGTLDFYQQMGIFINSVALAKQEDNRRLSVSLYIDYQFDELLVQYIFASRNTIEQ